MTVARRLQVGSVFVVPAGALKFGGALVRVVKRDWLSADDTRASEGCAAQAAIQVEFRGVDIPEISGSIVLAPSTELDEP